MRMTPPGVDTYCLIEPTYTQVRQWGIFCIKDRLTFRQIRILIEGAAGRSQIYGSYSVGAERCGVHLEPKVQAIAEFFVEMVGGNVCVYDLPNSFVLSVLEGDITLVSTSVPKLQKIFGSTDMSQADWVNIAKDLRQDISSRLLDKYANRL